MCRKVLLVMFMMFLVSALGALLFTSHAGRPTTGPLGPYYSALADAGIPSAFAEEQSCPHTFCGVNPHGLDVCKSGPGNTECITEPSCDTILCP